MRRNRMSLWALLLLVVLAAASCGHSYEIYRSKTWRPCRDEEPHETWLRLAIRGRDGVDSAEDLATANAKARQVFVPERCAIRKAGRDPRIGLALSGGGIRSAAYAMGVLRGLYSVSPSVDEDAAEGSLLDRIGYLSTVSGGGFGGGWYVSHRRDDELFRGGSPHLQHVAGSANYLTSSHYSETYTDLFGKALVHAAALPFAALLDEVFHLQFNVYGIRDFYRRAIQNAFLYRGVRAGDSGFSFPSPFGRACSGDRTMRQYLPSGGVLKPFWIVNSHLILKDETLPIYRNRSGDAFETTPLWAGARAVGYVRVPPIGTADQFWMQPCYATAISGAAFDSDSLSLDSARSLIGYLLNFDLGYFIRSWNDVPWYRELWWLLTSPLPINRGLALLFPAALKIDHRFTRRSKYLGLTDGGHFENLGAYALVRRGVRFIMIADASEDPLATQWDDLESLQRGRAFADLRRLTHLLELDFGLTLNVKWDTFRVQGVPTLLCATVDGLPDGPLRVVVLKAAYQIPEDLDSGQVLIDSEKARNPKFPDDPLLRQFFREDRFLAYERLGFLTVTNNEQALRCELRKAIR